MLPGYAQIIENQDTCLSGEIRWGKFSSGKIIHKINFRHQAKIMSLFLNVVILL